MDQVSHEYFGFAFDVIVFDIILQNMVCLKLPEF